MEMENRADLEQAEVLGQVSARADLPPTVGDCNDGNLSDKDSKRDQKVDAEDSSSDRELKHSSKKQRKETPDTMIKVRVNPAIDVIDDGFRWKKYGQKTVVKSPYPRKYYKCASVGCPVKKKVERSHEDPMFLEITYNRGKHICGQASNVANSLNSQQSDMTIDCLQQPQKLSHHQQSDTPTATQADELSVDEPISLEMQSSEAEQGIPFYPPSPDKSDVSSPVMTQPSSSLKKEQYGCLISLSECNSTTDPRRWLKISNCSAHDLWFHLKRDHCFEFLEFDSCSFPSTASVNIPVSLKELKITNCLATECLFTSLLDPKLSIESLEIDSCSTLLSFSMENIPPNVNQLKIVNCMNLKSIIGLKTSSKHDAIRLGPRNYMTLSKLVIQNCPELEYLPEDLHRFRNLDTLSIKNCCSLEHFPEGGLPYTCLRTLEMSECENLKHLPNKLEMVIPLQNLSISDCPSLEPSAEEGLPPKLVSLRIINCENFTPVLSLWDLDKLEHLKLCTFVGGCPNSL